MERLMQYVWQHRLWVQADMRTVDGRRVQVLDPGRLNRDAGPDFFNAKVVIDGVHWAGDVEIHVRASDWHRHGHDGDPAYDSVILHVVERDDTLIERRGGGTIPQVCMPCSRDFSESYNYMVGRSDIDLPCAAYLKDIPEIYVTDWMGTLGYERLYGKASRIVDLAERMGGDWESACYVVLARALGFGVNGEPFERLALSAPLRFIGKHSDSLFAIEAILFGQSGLLPAEGGGEYAEGLRNEYAFMAHKFGLRAPGNLGWKMSRMRPANFPHRRIAALAAMLEGGLRLMQRILELEGVEQARGMLNPRLSGYWANHFGFGAPSARVAQEMSMGSLNVLVINTVVPVMFAYGMSGGDEKLMDRAVGLLQAMPAERNRITGMFSDAGIVVRDAFHSQAVVQLRRGYCEPHKCLYCRIGHRVLAQAARGEVR